MKKRTSPSHSSQLQFSFNQVSWGTREATILSAMEFITTYEPSLLDEQEESLEKNNLQMGVDSAYQFLQQKLAMDSTQIRLITYILYHSAKHSSACDNEDLSNMLKIHPLRMMQLTNDLYALEEMGYLYSMSDSMNTGWRISKEAREALVSNQAFDIQRIKMETSIDFLIRANEYIKDGKRFDMDGSIVNNLRRFMTQNAHLPLVQHLNNLPTEEDKWFMLIMMTVLAIDEDDYVSGRDLEQILSNKVLRNIFYQMKQKKHLFVTKNYVVPYCQNGMAQANQWVLSQQAWIDMLGSKEEADLVMPESEDENIQALTPFSRLTVKQLFFSGRTKEQVDKLTHMLKEEQYTKIAQELKKRGMPTGFCCLFYGTPGTGKTELAQQLAIATKRNLMQVELATLRDKFVGESEKQIKEIFVKYRALVKSQERAPILFFNEADAIFGNRMENTQRSVDKMENAIQNIILQEMEQLEGIMICTTNLTTCLDKAFDRRFLFKLEIEKPTNEVRKQIWQSMLAGLNDEQATELANRFDFSGGQIQNISRKQVINAIFSGNDNLDYEQIKIDCQNESISRNNGRKIGF